MKTKHEHEWQGMFYFEGECYKTETKCRGPFAIVQICTDWPFEYSETTQPKEWSSGD